MFNAMFEHEMEESKKVRLSCYNGFLSQAIGFAH